MDVHHKDESNFQNIFYAIFRLFGYYIQAESRSSDGRIDAIAETDNLLSHKRIMLIGINFDTETGKLSGWKNEEVAK